MLKNVALATIDRCRTSFKFDQTKYLPEVNPNRILGISWGIRIEYIWFPCMQLHDHAALHFSSEYSKLFLKIVTCCLTPIAKVLVATIREA